MKEAVEHPAKAKSAALLRAMRPAVPAVIGAAALTFLFAAVMPLSWVAGIAWNLYLDRLSDLFVPPVGNGGRLAMALGMAMLAALIAGIAALLVAQPAAVGLSPSRRRARRSPGYADADSDAVPPRRRADVHPDDPPRPPIRAGRDLPAEGLGPVVPPVVSPVAVGVDHDLPVVDRVVADHPSDADDALVLADLAPDEPAEAADAPWSQPADVARPALPDPADKSLGAMVARFEAGLGRRRPEQAAIVDIPVPEKGADADEDTEDEDTEIDFALEAALGTLARMNRHAAG